MAGRRNSRAGDLTGRRKEELAKEHAAEQEAAAKQISLATAEAAAQSQETVELTPTVPEVVEKTVEDIADGLEVTDVDRVDPLMEKVKFRVVETLEQVTIGHGNNYDFVQGQEYSAPRYIYDHLEEKGLIWH